jgi:hypothetical protein
VGRVKEWCKEFKPVSEASRGDARNAGTIPSANVLTLSHDGSVIGLDGRPLKMGHVDAEWRAGILPFPSSCLLIQPLPLDELRSRVAARRQRERAAIDAMLSDAGVKESLGKMSKSSSKDSKPYAIKLMEYGFVSVNAMFAGDSHKKMTTCFLPATASMPQAIYSPDKIYRAKRPPSLGV